MTAAGLLTDLGDFAVAAPTAAVVAIWLWTQVDRSLALVFACGFVGLVAGVGALKIFAHAAAPAYVAGQLWGGVGSHAWGLSTGAPSGHAALAVFVYGGGGLILIRLGRGADRIAGAGLGVAAIVTVAVTRVTLRHHTIADVAAGVLVGAAFAAVFGRMLIRATPTKPRSRPAWLLAAILVTPALALASGLRLPSTHLL